jgi:hypothetical protein
MQSCRSKFSPTTASKGPQARPAAGVPRTRPNKGKQCFAYYVLYFPNLTANEAMTLGVIIHCPDKGSLYCRFIEDMMVVKKCHPQADTQFLRELPLYFERHIRLSKGHHGEFLKEVGTYSNLVQVTKPVTCWFNESPKDLEQFLTRELGRHHHERATSRRLAPK